MFNVYKYQQSRQTGSRNLMGSKTLPTIWGTYVKFVTKYQINCWWQKSDSWSQASYRYTILWVAFLDPSDSCFLFADFVGFYAHWTYMHIFRHIFPLPSGSGGINIISVCIDTFSSNIVGILYHLKGHYLPNRKFLLPIKTIRYDWCLNKTCFCNRNWPY
jgi:hypothetical protein